MATKYGDKAALEHAATALREHGVGVLYDVVFNHKLGADEKERVHVFKVDANNRNDIDDQGFDALAYTRFTFPAARARIPNSSGITPASAASTTLSNRTIKGCLKSPTTTATTAGTIR